MYGKCTLFYESPKNWGIICACANSVYQASPGGGGGGGGGEEPGDEAIAADTFLLKIKIHQFLVTHLVPEGDESSDSVPPTYNCGLQFCSRDH